MRDFQEHSVVSTADSTALELQLQRFERSWQLGSPIEIGDFLSDLTEGGEGFAGPHRFRLVTELVAIDLEKRWRAAARRSSANTAPQSPEQGITRPVLEDYLRKLPELNSLSELPILLIGHEYRVRHLWGDRPSASEYRVRFAAQRSAVESELAAIDRELSSSAFAPSCLAEPPDPALLTCPYVPAGTFGSVANPAACPQQIGKYLVLGRLGVGSYGVVYDAHDPLLGRNVAIKVPHPARVAEFGGAQPFLQEARTVANLDHPGIVPVYESGTTSDGLCYVVTKRLTGGDLEQLLATRRLSQHVSVELVAGLAEAVHHAHQHGLVHRDIKPANVLLDDQGRALLADFGMALRESDFGEGPRLAGTLKYMSPEQASGRSHLVDARSDIFGLGILLFELLCGRSPYRGESPQKLTSEIIKGQPRPMRQLDDSISEELDRICQKARALRPEDRYVTAADMAADLRRYLDPRPEKSPQARPVWPAPVAILTLGLLLAIGWLFYSPPSGTIPPVAIAPFLNLYLQPQGAEDTLPRSLQSHDLPLHANDRVLVDVGLRAKAYLYVLEFAEGQPARLLWPTDLNDQRPVSGLSDTGKWLALDLAGAPRRVMLVAATSVHALSEADLTQVRRVAFSLADEITPAQPLKEFLYPPDTDRSRVRGSDRPTIPLDADRLSRHPERELQQHFQAFAAQVFYYGSME